MRARQRYSASSIGKRLSFFAVTLTLLLPISNAFADSFLLVRIVDGLDPVRLSALKDATLSAVVEKDKKGDIVVRCLNFSLPLARDPFNDNPGMQKLMKRTRLQVDPKGGGVVVKLAFAF